MNNQQKQQYLGIIGQGSLIGLVWFLAVCATEKFSGKQKQTRAV